MVGKTVNHYRVVKPLGRGGMGDVYLAEDVRLKRPVALKFLPRDVASDSSLLERLEREAQVLAGLNHPNIVTVHSIERDGETLFITMEYLDGRTLAEIVTSGGLPLARLLTLATQVLDAVVAAHGRGIVHRDLKPTNVMVLAGDRVKVLDFGLAKLRDGPDDATLPTEELTGEGKIVGTVAYMSPEQAEGRSVDQRSDVFALGVILYELATGERPFKGDTNLAVLSAVLRDAPRAVTELNPAVPRDVWRIVRHCLAKDPDRRYQTAKDLRNDLEDLAQSLSSGELSAPLAVAAAPPRRWWIAAAVAAVLLVLTAAAWKLAAPASVMDAAPPTLSHRRLTQRDGQERWPTLSPDGKWVAYVADGDIYLQSVTGQTAINLTKDLPSNETTPAFSPDGETIAFRSTRDGGGIFLMGRTGESIRRMTSGGFHPAWFPDGKSIVYASGEGPAGPENRSTYSELWTAALDASAPRRLFGGDAVQPRVSPHGRRIAFWSIPSDPSARRFSLGDDPTNRDIWTIDVTGGDPVKVTGHDANDWNPVWSPDGHWLYFLSNRSGSMGLWRVAIDEATGVTHGDPQPLTVPAWYVADFNLSADGSSGVYTSILVTNNVARVAFDPKTATIKGDVEMITTGTNDFAWLDVSKDGGLLALTTSSRTREDLYVFTIANGSMRQLTNDFARDRWPRWSPDATSIYFYSDRRGYEVWRINADGGGLREITREPGLKQMYPSLSPDGARLAAGDQERRTLTIYDTGDFNKPLKMMSAAVEPKVGALQVQDWSPDGRSLLLVALSPTGALPTLWSYEVDSGTPRRIAQCAGATWMKDGQRIVCNRGRVIVVDARSGQTIELPITGPSTGGLRLAVDDSQLFFLRGTVASDIWVTRLGEATGGQ